MGKSYRLLWVCAVALGMGTSALADEVPENAIRVGTERGAMAFDITAFTVKAGSEVTVVFQNDDAMEHNIIFASEPGGEEVYMALGRQALEMGVAALEAQYVPDSELVLAYSRLLQPGERDVITFTAPETPGAYPYVCTVFGHPASMNGIMHVTEDGEPVEQEVAEVESAFRELHYRYYEGRWTVLPDFDDLEPVKSERAPGDLISMDMREQDDYFGFVFEGTLYVPESGSYTFLLRSDDGSRMYIDGELIIDHDGLHSAAEIKVANVELDAGERVFRAEHFEHTGDFALEITWIGPDGESGLPLTAGAGLEQMGRFIMMPADEAMVVRALLPGLSPRGIAVGTPDHTHYAFDAERLVVQYGWHGIFLDHGPMVGYGSQRGPNDARPLSDPFELGAINRPLRIGDPDEVPTSRFRGYELDERSPRFMFQVNGIDVTQTVQPLSGGQSGFEYYFTLSPAPEQAVYYHVDPAGLVLESSAGTWDAGVLTIPADETESFSITVRRADP